MCEISEGEAKFLNAMEVVPLEDLDFRESKVSEYTGNMFYKVSSIS